MFDIMETQPNERADITRKIISPAYISENLHNFFPDSIFLDRDYKIVAVSAGIALQLGYRPDDIIGQSLAILRNKDLLRWISRSLVPGFFVNERLTIRLKAGLEVEYVVSGFYLGILSSTSDLIIVRFDPHNEVIDLN